MFCSFVLETSYLIHFIIMIPASNFTLILSALIETKVDQSKNPSCTSISSQQGNLQHHKH